jgi:hypothetical protein
MLGPLEILLVETNPFGTHQLQGIVDFDYVVEPEFVDTTPLDIRRRKCEAVTR